MICILIRRRTAILPPELQKHSERRSGDCSRLRRDDLCKNNQGAIEIYYNVVTIKSQQES